MKIRTRSHAALLTLLALTALRPAGGRAAPAFALQPHDHICIIGNTLAERFQYDGWLETMLHARFPQHELVIRNLGFSGDEIDTRLRSKNFGTPDEWLSGKASPIGGHEENRFERTDTRADVIFAFFGYNESYAGEAGLDRFRTALGEWIDHTLAQRYNGKSAPRVVVFSPIAHEDLADPNLPDGRDDNLRLAQYTRAMGAVAAAHGVTFVDLYTPSLEMYRARTEPLTINGVHLNTAGNRLVAEAVGRALFGPEPQWDEAYLERIRKAVTDKNLYWFNRYRTVDGYSTYGDRAFLTFLRGNPRDVDAKKAAAAAPDDILPTNYEVLQRELPMLDIMTANRDRRIWAAANGKDLMPDDSNTPRPISARTNQEGMGADGSHEFLSGSESLAAMKTDAGVRVDLFASEAQFPDLINPVQMAFDAKGRLWVASWKNYPHWQPKTPMDDKLLIFEDTDGDGRADKSTVFAGDLENPTGFEFWNGGVLLAQPPNLVFLKDTDGDDKYDVKEYILHGFDTADTHHSINSFTFDPGGALYMQEGIFHRTQVESPWGPVTRQADGGVYRFEPKTWRFETYIPMNFPNPHGHVFDRWGRDIVFDATGGQPFYGPSFSTKKYYPAMESNAAPRPGTVRTRPVAGTEILSSRHFPEEMQGNLLVLNTIGMRGILSYRLVEDGAGLRSEEVHPLLESSDENFRPVDAEVAPDGSLYVLDWQNPIIGHMQHNLRDTSRDHRHGRIYRLTYPGRPLLAPVSLAGQPIPALLDALRTPEDRVRYRAKIELSSRPSADVLAALTTWVAALDPKDPQHEHDMMEALWVEQWNNKVDEALLRRMLKSPEPWARAAATRVLCYWRDRIDDPLGLLMTLATDPHPGVRLEAVRAASFFKSAQAAKVALESLDLPQDRFLTYTLDQTMATLRAGAAPRILYDVSPGAVEYQLSRLSPDELSRVERNDTDTKFRPVYLAMLTRKGMPRASFDEAIAALQKIDGKGRTEVILGTLPMVDVDDEEVGGKLLRALLAQPPTALESDKPALTAASGSTSSALARRAGYAGLLATDSNGDATWQAATRDGQLLDLLHAIPFLDRNAPAALTPRVAQLAVQAADARTRAAALAALASLRPDPATFAVLGTALRDATDDEMRMAAIAGLQRIPVEAWPANGVEPVVATLVELLRATPPDKRTSILSLDAAQLGMSLASSLPDEPGRPLRRELRELAVQVVRISTVPEQMRFDRQWFVVQAGKPVQIVLTNPDTMSHNLVVGRPGSVRVIGTAAAAMSAPASGSAKAYVPAIPQVVRGTGLLNWGETARLDLVAPYETGSYVFLCTFPGHWVRMYGVMLVVSSLDDWERTRVEPTDPITGKPFVSPQ